MRLLTNFIVRGLAIWLAACAVEPRIAGEGSESVRKARALYEAGEYVQAMRELESDVPATADIILWLWRGAQKISEVADPAAGPKAGAYEAYIAQNSKYFKHQEGYGYAANSEFFEKACMALKGAPAACAIVVYEATKQREEFLSEDGLDAEGRLELIARYQRYLNHYPGHEQGADVKKEITRLESLKGLNSSFAAYFGRIFRIDPQRYQRYVEEWLTAGSLREHGIVVLANRREYAEFIAQSGLPEAAKKELQIQIDNGNLVVCSGAAFLSPKWQGGRFVAFPRRHGPGN